MGRAHPRKVTSPLRLLMAGGVLLLSACAGPTGPRSDARDARGNNLEALRDVTAVAVSADPSSLARYAASVLRKEGGPSVVPALGTVDVLDLSLRCGSDLVAEGVMPNRPLCNGFGDEVLAMRLDASEGSRPACEGSLVLRRNGRPIWWIKDWAPCRSEQDVLGFAERLAGQFASDWKAARPPSPPRP